MYIYIFDAYLWFKTQLLSSNLLKLKPVLSTHLTRETGKRHPIKYNTSPFFYLHTINAYEEDGHIVIDICCYARC